MLLAIPLLGERVGPLRWSAAAVALLGALVLIRPGSEAYQPAALIALASAALIGVEMILIKRLSDREPPLRILVINNAIGALIAAIAAAFVWTLPSPSQWAMLAALGFSMLGAQALFIQALRAADASYVVPFFYTTLVFAALYDMALFGDWPDAFQPARHRDHPGRCHAARLARAPPSRGALGPAYGNSSGSGAKVTSGSSGQIGRRQTLWPRLKRLALVEPGASTLRLHAAQASKNCGWQCGDLTTIASKARGSWPCARNSERSNRATGRVVSTRVRRPARSTAVRPASSRVPQVSSV